MPNHLHALIAPENQGLGEVLQSWKGGSAFEINRLLGRSGPLWQKEPYDHIVRSEAQFQHYRGYIAESPIKAGVEPHEYAVGLGKQPFKVASALAEIIQPPRTQN
jgi:REP element-mobilizing transposase RayT